MNNSRLRILFAGVALLLALTVSLSACGEGTVTEAVSPAETQTLNPTSTRTITPTHTENYHQTLAAERTVTAQARQTLYAQYHANCGDPWNFFLVSPDRQWLASGCSDGQTLFWVSNKDGNISWKIPYEVPSYKDIAWSSSFCESYPLHWSNDSRYVFFHLWPCATYDPVPDYVLGMPAYPQILYRMDTQTGIWQKFIPAANYFSFSPTGRRLVYIKRDGWSEDDIAQVIIHIVDLNTGEITMFYLDNHLAAANVVWSQDGTGFVFAAVHGSPWEYYTDPKQTYSLYMVDTNSQSLTLLENFPDSEYPIYPVEWNGSLITMYFDYLNQYSNYDHNVVYFDLTTSQRYPPTPTP